MRDSGVEWLGKVPKHWEVWRARYIFRAVDQRSRHGLEQHLSMSQTLGLVPSHLVENRTLVSESYAGGKLCEVGDVVLNRLKAHLGVFALAHDRGIVSPDYTVLRLRKAGIAEFFEQTLRSSACRRELRTRARGIVEGFWRLYTDDFNEIRIPLPPFPEQTAIVRFLDHADRRIRRYTRAKERLIELLEEQKQVIIHEAVTGQIDVRTGQPYPAYKDSGVEWLGEVPEHWQLVPNRAVLSRRKVLVGETHTERELLSLTKSGVIVRDISTGRGKFSADMGTSQEVRRGDLVFCLFDVPETPRTVGLSHHNGMITGAYTVFECDDHLLRRFLECFYIAMDDRKLLAPLYTGLRNTIPPSRFLHVRTPIPPREEQTAILLHLSDTTRAWEGAMKHAKREIELLNEYRTRLINDVVTGKLDVREAAASLPEVDPLESENVCQEPEANDSVGLEATDRALDTAHA